MALAIFKSILVKQFKVNVKFYLHTISFFNYTYNDL